MCDRARSCASRSASQRCASFLNVHHMILFKIFSRSKLIQKKMLSLFSILAVSDVSQCIGKDGKLSPCGPGNQAREKSR